MAMTTNQQKTDVYYWRYKHYSNYDSLTPYPGIDRRLDPLNPANFVRLSLSSSWAVFIFFTGLGASSSVSSTCATFSFLDFLLFFFLTSSSSSTGSTTFWFSSSSSLFFFLLFFCFF